MPDLTTRWPVMPNLTTPLRLMDARGQQFESTLADMIRRSSGDPGEALHGDGAFKVPSWDPVLRALAAGDVTPQEARAFALSIASIWLEAAEHFSSASKT